MKNDQNDETIKEILKEDQEIIVNRPKKKSCLIRGLIFLILLIILFFGFILIQQYILDIEAEAIVRTAKTATAMVKNPTTEENSGEEDSQVNSKNTSGDQIPTETPTLDPAFERTATVAVQLTKVSEFQQEVTKEP